LPGPAALLGACCLALFTLPADAAGTRVKMVTRSYQVADLVIPLSHAEAGPARGPEKAPQATTLEDRLIKLLVRTIRPASWAENGGRGTIDYFPLTMTLVIAQTPKVHEKIASLLGELRKMQDVEVALEVRFVTVSEAFFWERVGVDFNVQSRGDHCPAGPAVKDLVGCRLKQVGPTFLDDKQVYQLMEAVQGDQRASVMQAPRVTLANGQTATVHITDTRFFLTGVDVVPCDGHNTVRPKNEPVDVGFRMTAQPVVSPDRRFVQLFFKLQQTDLAEVVPLMPVAMPVKNSEGQEVMFQLFVQQPQLSKLTVEKMLAIPDGRTAVFGGFRKMGEVRHEYGPPVLRSTACSSTSATARKPSMSSCW
jgi:general secretion pathway protein D